jgi:hypothetical protein
VMSTEELESSDGEVSRFLACFLGLQLLSDFVYHILSEEAELVIEINCFS